MAASLSEEVLIMNVLVLEVNVIKEGKVETL
jgi:hypothetical protein